MATSVAAPSVRGIRISHPDRIVYPDLGLSKIDLVRYYDRVAERMFPHVRDRPLTLVHCPDGLQAPCNYMRHRRMWGPEVLKRVRIQEKTKVGEYLAVVTIDGIIALAQMGIVEVHTWNTTIGDVERPNRLIWDLDPGPEVSWPKVIAAAKAVRQLLETLGLQSWVKTTGGRGLHVVAPLVAERPWDECLAFSKAVAEALTAADSRAYTTAFAKRGREQKILIDYLRNNRTNTSIAAFSARARPAATVSMPVSWRQLTPRFDPQAFTIETIPTKAAADPWREYWSCRQTIDDDAFAAIAKLRT